MLPGLDLGDSASFQTAVGYLTLTPRQAYPLYYALGNVFAWIFPSEPAWAANLASAVYGAAAVAVCALIAARLAESRVAGAAAALFLAFSYTFWTQAVTAEVYTLHLLLTGLCLMMLLRWAEQPTTARLATFYAVYALSFGNHLSMILWLPAFTIFLLVYRTPGRADPLRPRMMALAAVIAAAGALQYAWNFRGMWVEIEPPESIAQALGKLWFDVTKSDWRETLVMSLSEDGFASRPAMYWFDLRQQFGPGGVVLASIGASYILMRWPRRWLVLAIAYGANMAFAWTYNVGDAYIFFLPSHYVVALCAGAGVAAIAWMLLRVSNEHVATVAGIVCLAYPLWRGHDTFPAVDRSADTRAPALLDRFTTPPGPVHQNWGRLFQNAIFGADANWQVQNGWEYFMRERKPEVPWFITEDIEWLEKPDVTQRFHAFVEANHEMAREVIVSPAMLRTLRQRGVDEEVTIVRSAMFMNRILSVPQGSAYALGVLWPDPEYPLDQEALAATWFRLTGAGLPADLRLYTIVIGRAGEPPLLIRTEDRPFRVRTTMGPLPIDVRMESWLPTDTIRRAGFGHVIVDRRHVLTLERGISFTEIERHIEPAYSSGLFEDIPRLLLGRH